jgi:hypothetical protein
MQAILMDNAYGIAGWLQHASSDRVVSAVTFGGGGSYRIYAKRRSDLRHMRTGTLFGDRCQDKRKRNACGAKQQCDPKGTHPHMTSPRGPVRAFHITCIAECHNNPSPQG